MRRFKVTGPVEPSKHYAIPPLGRVPLARIEELVEIEEYFVFHAPRQTGKTSVLGALQEHLNARGWRCVYASCEDARAAGGDLDTAVRAVLLAIASDAATVLGDESLGEVWPPLLSEVGGVGGFRESLRRWSEKAGDERLVLLLDEADGLEERILVALLSQLRSGFRGRPRRFPRSIVFCGLRDVQDYPLESGSAFNIVEESLRLGDFSRTEVEELLGQHTEETGQGFAAAAIDGIWDATAGQPWLVNALAKETCFEDEAGLDRTREIGPEAVEAARERLILRRPTHYRQIGDKLKEERVRRVIEPILAGRGEYLPQQGDDSSYVRDLGLVKATGPLEIANPIYREVIPRLLSVADEDRFGGGGPSFRRGDGGLDVAQLLTAFQQFYREHSEWWSQGFTVREAAVQVLLQAFLQRVVNAGGRIVREYGLGRGRTDLLIEWRRDDGGTQRFVVECKVRRERDGLETVVRDGVAQTAAYLDRRGAEEGHLVVMDQDDSKTWEEKIFRRALAARRVPDPDSEPGGELGWEAAETAEAAPGEDADAPAGGGSPESLPILVWGM